MRHVNAAGLALIRRWEGLRLEAYRCKAGRLTIGYGHTGPEVREGMVIREETADRLFWSDVQRHSLELERSLTANVTHNQWAAMVSLAFNMGAPAIGRSTLMKLVNAGDFVQRNADGEVVGGAAAQFLRWKYVDADPDEKVRKMVEDPGLLARRCDEMLLFLNGLGVVG